MHDRIRTQWNGGQALHHLHDRARTLEFISALYVGSPKVISNMKSLLETGSIVLQDPYPTAVSR